MTCKEIIELFDNFKRFIYDKNLTCDEFLWISGLIDEYLYIIEDNVRFESLEEMDSYLEETDGGWSNIKDIKPNKKWHNMKEINLSPVKEIINKIKEVDEEVQENE